MDVQQVRFHQGRLLNMKGCDFQKRPLRSFLASTCTTAFHWNGYSHSAVCGCTPLPIILIWIPPSTILTIKSTWRDMDTCIRVTHSNIFPTTWSLLERKCGTVLGECLCG